MCFETAGTLRLIAASEFALEQARMDLASASYSDAGNERTPGVPLVNRS
jgi:hypothetical protein